LFSFLQGGKKVRLYIRCISILTVIAITLSFLPVSFNARAENITSDGFEWEAESNVSYHIIAYHGNEKNVVIPTFIGSANVTAIQIGAFQNNTKIESVVIPEGVNYLCRNAFAGCTSLKSVSIPSTVKEWQGGAFDGCTSLTTVTAPAGATSIAVATFRNCTSLEEITVPEGVKNVGNSAFEGCTSLKRVILPESLLEIGSSSFRSCTSLETINIPESVISIGGNSFSNTPSTAIATVSTISAKNNLSGSGFKGTILGAPVENAADYKYEINSDGFAVVTEYIGSDSRISVPYVLGGKKVVGIGDGVFKDKAFLERVYLNVGVTYVGNNSFSGCTGLKLISFPEKFEKIGKEAFKGCTSLKGLVVELTVTYIGKDAFADMSNDLVIKYTAENVLDLIKASGYTGKTQYTPANDPKDYTYIQTGTTAMARGYVGSRSEIIVPEKMGENSEYDTTALAVGTFRNSKVLKKVTVCDTVTWIGEYAFAGCTSLQEVVLPPYIIGLSNYLFENCTSLKSVIIPNDVTEIGESAFSGCTALTSVTIPEGVIEIGKAAFYNNTALRSITIPSTVESIGENAFEAVSNDLVVTVPSEEIKEMVRASSTRKFMVIVEGRGTEKQDDYTFSSGNLTKYNGNDKNIIIPSKIAGTNTVNTGISSSAFNGKKTLIETVTVSEGYTIIRAGAFMSCTNLKKVYLPESITSVLNFAFRDVNADCVVYVPNSRVEELVRNSGYTGVISGYYVTDEDDYSYEVLSDKEIKITAYNGSDIQIGIPSKATVNDKEYTVAAIAENVFASKNIEKISIPNTVLDIEAGAFKNCTGLEAVVLPEKLTRISKSLFEGCVNLKKIICFDGILKIEENAFKGTAISEFDFPDYIKEIKTGAFADCESLKKINPPESLKTLESGAFEDTVEVETLLESTEKVFVKSGFKGKISGVAVTIADDYVYEYYYNNTKARVKEYKGDDKRISIPSHTPAGIPVCSIAKSAFTQNRDLTAIIIPDTVEEIEANSFEGCIRVEYLKISEGLYLVRPRTFQNLSRLKELVIPDYIHEIGHFAFRYNYCLKEIRIPELVETIQETSFYYNSGIREVYIPDNVNFIGTNAFYTNSNKTQIYCSEKIKEMLDNISYTGVINVTDVSYANKSTATSWRFNSKESLKNLYTVEGDDTEISYDSKENAAKIIAKDINGDGKLTNAGNVFFISDGQSEVYDSQLDVDKYMYLLVNVKRSGDVNNSGIKWVTTYSRSIRGKNIHPGRGNEIYIPCNISDYKLTDDWQTVIITATASDFLSGNWVSIGLNALGGTENLKEGDCLWIKDARIVDAEEYGEYISGGSSNGDLPTLIDFTLPSNYSKILWSNQTDTNAVYDTQMHAVKVSAKDAVTGSAADGMLSTSTAYFMVDLANKPVNDYPILAIRLKLNNKYSSCGWFGFSTSGSLSESSKYYDITKPVYSATNDWQTIIIDCSESNTMAHLFTGNWQSACFNLTYTASAVPEDIFWVEWVGIFRSVQEAINSTEALAVKDGNDEEEEIAPLPDLDTDIDDSWINDLIEEDVEEEASNSTTKRVVKKRRVVVVGKNNYLLVTIIAVAAVLTVAAGTVVFIILRKKRKRKNS